MGKPAVAFLHPDLGIGGAERLVIDAGLALIQKGHAVHFYTSHHDPDHCFEETRDGTLKVTVYGDWLPRHVFGYLHAVCAYVRMIYLAFAVLIVTGSEYPVMHVDQVSCCLPVLRWFGSAKIIFYCHFPDQLLAQRRSALKRFYRAPLDWLEEWTTGMADSILVNSKFTARTFAETFKSLKDTNPEVLYPSLNFEAFDKVDPTVEIDKLIPKEAKVVFLSINRFERKKNLQLAVEALSVLKTLLESQQGLWADVHLVMAGGYDTRVAENVEHHQELVDFVEEHGMKDNVTFLLSFSDGEKNALLKRCRCLIYTPSNEHFGIVPLEAMYKERGVIAVNSGGPLETVLADPAGPTDGKSLSGQTGFLCSPTAAEFGKAMEMMATDGKLCTKLGKSGRARVVDLFSFDAFATQLAQVVEAVL